MPWTRQMIEVQARASLLGRASKDAIHEMCQDLHIRDRGTKKALIRRIHQVLHIPFNEETYTAIGWVMPLKRRAGRERSESSEEEESEEPVPKRPRLTWEGATITEQVSKAKMDREETMVNIQALLLPIQHACAPILRETASFPIEHVQALEKICRESLQRCTEYTEHIEEIDEATKVLTLTHTSSSSTVVSLICPVCLDEESTKFKCLHPCGHIVCATCCAKLQRRCPKCMQNYLVSTEMYT
jgi:hypothetical protein